MNETTSSEAVVAATDGSPSSRAAVAWAAEEAARTGRPLRIVFVQEPWTFGFPDIPSPEFDRAMVAESARVVDDARELALQSHPDLEISTDVPHRDVLPALRDAAAGGFELVMGRRGHGRFAELVVGSTSLKVVGRTVRPVVVVGASAGGARNEVVVGVSLDDDPAPALRYAYEAAHARGAVLRAVHAWDVMETYAPMVREAPGFVDPAVRLGRLLAPWRERYPDVKTEEQVFDDSPVAALSAASEGADLLVVGSHGRGPVGSLFLGSVGHGVLHHAHCPVAVVPPERS